MASLPPRAGPPRRTSPRDQASSADARLPRTDSEAYSTTSVDSDTLLFNSAPSPPKTDGAQKPEGQQAAATASPVPQQRPHNDDDEPRRCWICFNDETEDAPDSSAWRSPCPCALVAHEACLLDWVASQEAPNARRQAGTGSKITCPQCKSEIHLKRPRSIVVDGVRAVEKFTGMLILPGTMGMLGYTVYQASFMHGVSTVYALFGLEDGYRILEPLHRAPALLTGRVHSSVAIAAITRFCQHARLHFGLSAIPPILVASRVSIADSILPILPVVFLASSSGSEDMLNLGHWPPSAALSFSLLPYIRGAYNTYMEKVWGERQRQWLREIQPRAGESEEEQGNGRNQDDDDDERLLEINVGLDILGDDDDDDDDDDEGEEDLHDHDNPLPNGLWPGDPRIRNLRNQRMPEHAPPFDAPPLQDDDAAAHRGPRPAAQQQQNQQPRRRPGIERRERNLIFQTTNIADTVLGALVFPSLAAAVGELIRLGLPRSWTTPPASGRPTGFLQQRWARSFLGGCLFVAVKDAVLLYVRWKMAQNHRKRRVLDYDKKRRRVVNP